ncbi:MAG: hypothetical protein DRO88_00835 [Promethearchaeia archaeon]|nr:MAG: hypothetical protein DRO88_00835 [Candidatus Lokiarchaeia archaeon]
MVIHLAEDQTKFRKEVISYYRRNVYDYQGEVLEWIPRNKTRILDIMKENFKDHSLTEIERVLNEYYSNM